MKMRNLSIPIEPRVHRLSKFELQILFPNIQSNRISSIISNPVNLFS